MNAGKDIENRDWDTRLRGRVAIHAAKGLTQHEYEDAAICISRIGSIVVPDLNELTRGAVIGTVEIVDCVTDSGSPWFFGRYGFLLRNPQPFAMPQQVKGALGFWEWTA
jgi:hypothetical protein